MKSPELLTGASDIKSSWMLAVVSQQTAKNRVQLLLIRSLAGSSKSPVAEVLLAKLTQAPTFVIQT